MHVVQPESRAIITADLQVGVSMPLSPGFDAYARGCRCTHLPARRCRYIAVGIQSQEQVDIVVVITF